MKYICNMETVQQNGRFTLFLVNSPLIYILFSMAISARIFQGEPNYSLGSNQIGVSISLNVFEVYMLQVKVDRRNYNSCVVIYITWLRQACYVFIAQL